MTNFIRVKGWTTAAGIKSSSITSQVLRGRQAVLGITVLTGAGDNYGTVPGKGTFGFTNSTADAEGIIDERLAYLSPIALFIEDLGVSELDRFLRCWTMLFADDTRYTFGKGQATILVEPGMAYLEPVFLIHIKHLYCPRRTDLPAESAVEFAIPRPSNEVG